MTNTDNYAVIMAGGIGSRFWPMSKAAYPKQFHDILGTGRTLIQMTYDRLLKISPKENILVVTNARYKDLVKEQLPDLEYKQILCEPFMRNTGPCIAYANWKIAEINPNANVVVAPSDHLILNENHFIEVLEIAIEQTKNTTNLVTLGIPPSRPDTGYGYIQFEEEPNNENHLVKRVKTFTEKPNQELAEQFVSSGEFWWNSGVFVWSLKNIMKAFDDYLPEMQAAFAEGKGIYNTSEEENFINTIYGPCENISIDYGIMEKAKNVNVVEGDFGWSDLGTWGSLYTHLDHDAHKNGIVGDTVMLFDSHNNVVNVPDGKLVVLQGIDDCIVVESDGQLLICKKSAEQEIKSIVNNVRIDKGEDFV